MKYWATGKKIGKLRPTSYYNERKFNEVIDRSILSLSLSKTTLALQEFSKVYGRICFV